MHDLIINIDGKNYEISPKSNINLSNVKEDNIFLDGFKNKYDASQDNIINSGEEINIFMDDLSKIVKEDNTLDNELLDKYFAELPPEKNNYTKKGFLDFLKSILPQSNKTNKWIVQNNQPLDKISKMILK